MSKRILSLVLALVMVLGTFGTVFAAETAEVVLDSKVQWLVEQGLLQGDGSGNLDLDKAITRDVLARIVAVALEDEKSAESLKALPSGFADMTPAHWANGYASYANAKGYMIGNDKTEFMPAGVVNYDQALVVLTKIALGGDLTAAEKANSLTWYAPYVAKANELGVTEGVTIANVGAPAIKEDIIKMLYNVLNNKDFGNYNVLKVVVLENDRIARLGENEVTVEVMKEVQRANFVDASREDLKGEQYTYELPAKFNAEDLLGKVADLSINKDGKVVEVKIDTTYEVKTGKVSDITASRLTIDKKEYIVNLDERYNREDERVYRTYLNDKDLKYTDFAKDNKEVEYARVTVKAGKVLFIDAYDFNDVMPVKSVGEKAIVSYDDVRDGNLIETKVSNARVILVNDKTFTRGTLENVKVDNVIHTYKVGTATKYVVLQDVAVEGKLDKITEDKDGEYVVVDGKEYTIPTALYKEAVYEFKSNDKFYTLDAKKAYRELDTFRGEEVRVLLGLDGKVQYIGSKIEVSEYVGVATRIVGRDMRVLNSEDKTNDYEANLDTKVVVGTTSTGHQGLNEITRNSLVYINSDDKSLVKVVDLDTQVSVTKLNNREVNAFRITDDSVVFVVNTIGEVEVRKIEDVVKAYDKLSTTEKGKVDVSLINEAKFDEISVRGYKFNKATNVHTMVLYNLNIKPAQKDAIYGKLIRYDNRRIENSDITVELANGARRTFMLDKSIVSAIDFKEGAIYTIVESKEKENLALSVKKVIFGGYREVVSVRNGEYTFTTGTNLFEARNTEYFGRKPVKGDKISYVLNDDYATDMDLIVNPGYTSDVENKGVVSSVSATGFVVDSNKAYFTTDKTILRGKDGSILITGKNLSSLLPNGTQVDVTANGDDVVEVKIVKTVADLLLDTAIRDAKTAQTAHTVAGGKITNVEYKAVQTALDATTPSASAINAAVDTLNLLTDDIKAAKAAQVAYLAAGGLNTDAVYKAVSTALAADPQVKGNITGAITALESATANASDLAMVNAELAKVVDLEVAATIDQPTIKAAVEAKVNLNKVTVSVPAAAEANGKWKITLTSKAAASTANKEITVTTADQTLVNAELVNVVDLELPTGATIDQPTIKAAVEAKVDLNKVTVSVPAAAEANGKWKITLTSKVAASTANKEITVTVQ